MLGDSLRGLGRLQEALDCHLRREAEARARLQEAMQVFTDIAEEDSAASVRAELLA